MAPALVWFLGPLTDMERQNTARKTREGLKAARAEGNTMGAAQKLNEPAREVPRADIWGMRKTYGVAKSMARRIAAEGNSEREPATPTTTVAAAGPHPGKTCAEAAKERVDRKCGCPEVPTGSSIDSLASGSILRMNEAGHLPALGVTRL